MPRRRYVRHTEEFERIANLPRRRVTREDAELWSEVLTPIYRRNNPKEQHALLPWQALALAEAEECQGALLGFPVGTGKTLIYELAPAALKSRKAVLLLPAALREKTYDDRRAYAKTWKIASPPARILTKEILYSEANQYLLDHIEPDLILVDEGDELANTNASMTKRIDRYITKNRATYPPGHPKRVRVIIGTGTLSRQSIMGYWHLVMWTHGYWEDRPPLPFNRSEAHLWASALDHSKGAKAHPGPLGTTLANARAWYRERLSETPGVILVDEDSCKAPLTIHVQLAQEDPKMDEAFKTLLKENHV